MNNGYFYSTNYCPFVNNLNNLYRTIPEQIDWEAVSREIEEAKNTYASVSGGFNMIERIDMARPDEDSELIGVRAQLGPWNTGQINFSGGVPVSGYAGLTLYSNGGYYFTGHFHVSGAPSYNYTFAWAVRDYSQPPNIFVFAHSGHLHGTFEPGSRNDDWEKSDKRADLAKAWPSLQKKWSYKWKADVNIDLKATINSVVNAVKYGVETAAVVVAILA